MKSFKFENDKLCIVNQRKLPSVVEWVDVENFTDGYNAIKEMQVRGAPLIGIIGCITCYIELLAFSKDKDVDVVRAKLCELVGKIITARPTAVNLKNCCEHMLECTKESQNTTSLIETMKCFIEKVYEDDAKKNFMMTKHALEHVSGTNLNVLTHCNTGSLATCDWGTAFGVIRGLYENGQLDCVYVTETRPWNQGSRLTVSECRENNIPYKLITDSTAAYLMSIGKVDYVFVGADRILSNGNTANKIGTYSLAVSAKHHNVPFYVVADTSTYDKKSLEFEIEFRNEGVEKENRDHFFAPSFDVTPPTLITGYINENGLLEPNILAKKIGIIGGSGVKMSDIHDGGENSLRKIPRPINEFGKASGELYFGSCGETEFVFISRHGPKHSICPTNVNFKANIKALIDAGCTHIIATTACGSLKEEYKPGELVCLDDCVDYTKFRSNTIFNKEPVVCHVPMAKPFSKGLRDFILNCSEQHDSFKLHSSGTTVTIEGPRFSTQAESKMFVQHGFDVINMTTCPEVFIAKELCIPYASIAMVTDYDCWKEDNHVDVASVMKVMQCNSKNVSELLVTVMKNFVLYDKSRDEDLTMIVESSIVSKH